MADAGVRLTVVGDGVALERVRTLADEIDARNVRFLGSVPMEQMAAVYDAADFAAVTLKDLPAFRGTIPSKFQAALAHGVPVVTNVQGDLRHLVESIGLGFTADSEDVGDLAEALSRAARTVGDSHAVMIRRVRETYADLFSTESGVSAVEQILEQCVNNDAHRRSTGSN